MLSYLFVGFISLPTWRDHCLNYQSFIGSATGMELQAKLQRGLIVYLGRFIYINNPSMQNEQDFEE